MTSPKRFSWGRTITVVIVCACAGTALLVWFNRARKIDHARAQLYLVGKAVAAYIAASGGQFPPDVASLREANVVKDVSPGCVAVIAGDPDGYPPWAAQAPFTVQLDGFEVGWSGVPVDSSGLMVRSRVYGAALDDAARRISEELRRFAREVERRH